MMKSNTQKLLLWLYGPASEAVRVVGVSQLRLILPDLKPSGFRSLLNHLERQSLIFRDASGGQNQYGLTSHGMTALEAQFPVLNWSDDRRLGTWSLITFIEAPASDKQFRYLRQFLLDQGCGQLSRGNYLFPGQLSVPMTATLNQLYIGKVLVTGIERWIFGDERLVVNRVFNLADLRNGYSGISKEVDQLLSSLNRQKSIEDKDKLAICMVFDRLADLLRHDLGLLQRYFPDVKSGSELLFRLQRSI